MLHDKNLELSELKAFAEDVLYECSTSYEIPLYRIKKDQKTGICSL